MSKNSHQINIDETNTSVLVLKWLQSLVVLVNESSILQSQNLIYVKVPQAYEKSMQMNWLLSYEFFLREI